MIKVYTIFPILVALTGVSFIGNDSVQAATNGFAPQYLGAGAGVAITEGAREAEAALHGAYRLPVGVPVSFRAAAFPVDGLEFNASLTYDLAAAKSLNIFAGPGVFGNRDQVYPTLGFGAEYLFDKANTVVFASYDRVFIENSGANLAKFGVGYQF